MNMREVEMQAKALAPVLKGFVAKGISAALQVFRRELDQDLDRREQTIRDAVAESLEGLPTDAAEIAKAAAALIEKPRDGAGVDPEEVRRMIAAEVEQLPKAKDGASVTTDDVLPLIQEQVRLAVGELPAPTPGKDGEDGKDGDSVPLDELKQLIDEAVTAAVAKVEIPAPIPGEDGEDGTSVSADEVRQMVEAAVKGATAHIVAPKDGEPGRDAAHIEILPAIDLAKSYPRGTYAKHLGGLWRSYESTTDLKGWECIVEGIASLSIEQHGERGLKAVALLSSGASREKALVIPTMIYRGVFAPGSYERGDTVTWGGSLWHCDEPTSDKPGELNSKGWRLTVKKGRDGKNGVDGKDMTKGVQIK